MMTRKKTTSKACRTVHRAPAKTRSSTRYSGTKTTTPFARRRGSSGSVANGGLRRSSRKRVIPKQSIARAPPSSPQRRARSRRHYSRKSLSPCSRPRGASRRRLRPTERTSCLGARSTSRRLRSRGGGFRGRRWVVRRFSCEATVLLARR